jgi:hypothetical protein
VTSTSEKEKANEPLVRDEADATPVPYGGEMVVVDEDIPTMPQATPEQIAKISSALRKLLADREHIRMVQEEIRNANEIGAITDATQGADEADEQRQK